MDGVRSRGGSVYCIGIGGVMMASLAILTARAGFPVSGSDRAFAGGCGSPTAQRLTAAGIRLFGDHAAAHLPPDCGAVIYTVAIAEDNPEYRAAAERGIPRFSRADYIGWLMTGYNRRVGVAGMHGKSTCTSMCAQVFLDAAADPTVLIGADYPPIGGAFRLGGREMFLFEACEYMDSFLDFRPTVAVLLNAELEHVDYFRDLSQIEDSFFRFASLTGRDGVTVCNADDACVARRCGRWRQAARGVLLHFRHRAQRRTYVPTACSWSGDCRPLHWWWTAKHGGRSACTCRASIRYVTRWRRSRQRGSADWRGRIFCGGLPILPVLPVGWSFAARYGAGSCLTTTGIIRPRSVPHGRRRWSEHTRTERRDACFACSSRIHTAVQRACMMTSALHLMPLTG